jgi:tRNA nucleotidyltransferase (CCA-adding enzyme)
VGGIVRDLLLELPATDIDIVVEGDAIALVKRLAGEFGGRVRSHGRFGTAKWSLSADSWQQIAPGIAEADTIAAIDFVTARTEFYTEPTALPEVAHGSIKLDLHRRDFTINTLAIRLDGPHLGELLDFYGGLRDLEQGLIRVLHSLSFIDDPTRIMRAVRLERRLNFAIESRTKELIADALPLLARVSGARLRHEIELAFEEPNPAPVFERLAELDVLAHIHPALTWEQPLSEKLRYLQYLLASPWREALQGRLPTVVMFTIWMISLSPGPRGDVMSRLRVRKSTIEVVEGGAKLARQLAALPENARPSLIERTIRPYAAQTHSLLAVRAVAGASAAGNLLDRYWQEWRLVRAKLDGHHLRGMGLKPGPHFASLLDQLLAARLDGEVVDEAGERALLELLLAQQVTEADQLD